MTGKELDQFICSELPDQYLSEKDSTGKAMVDGRGEPIYKQDGNGEKIINPLWTEVTSFTLHGPCGQYNPSLSCMVDGHCQFGYPKNYQATTEISEDGYPQYHQCEDPDKVTEFCPSLNSCASHSCDIRQFRSLYTKNR